MKKSFKFVENYFVVFAHNKIINDFMCRNIALCLETSQTFMYLNCIFGVVGSICISVYGNIKRQAFLLSQSSAHTGDISVYHVHTPFHCRPLFRPGRPLLFRPGGRLRRSGLSSARRRRRRTALTCRYLLAVAWVGL